MANDDDQSVSGTTPPAAPPVPAPPRAPAQAPSVETVSLRVKRANPLTPTAVQLHLADGTYVVSTAGSDFPADVADEIIAEALKAGVEVVETPVRGALVTFDAKTNKVVTEGEDA